MKLNNILTAILMVTYSLNCNALFGEGIQLIGNETKTLISNVMDQGILATFDSAQGSIERPVPENSYVIPAGQNTWTPRKGSARDLVNYMKKVEALNPGANWQQIVTRLHHFAYPYDGNYVMYGIPLFKEGEDNEGWQDIKLPRDEDLPFFIYDDDGQLVNFKHTLSGLRAACNREGTDRAIWMRVNTTLGDEYQVWNERKRVIERDSCALLPGETKNWVDACRNYTQRDDAKTAGEYFTSLKNAKRWYTEDQRLGNDLSFTLEKKLRKGRATNLSQAIESTFID